MVTKVFPAVVYIISLTLQSCTTETIPNFQVEGGQPAKVLVQIKAEASYTRQGRSVDQFPDQLDVELSTAEYSKQFRNLKRNFHVPDIQYVHMMENGKVKKIKFESKEKSAHYIDVIHGAAFRASLQSEESEDFYIYGTFISEQKEYLVQPPIDNQGDYTVSMLFEKPTTSFDFTSLSDQDAKIIQEKSQNRSQQTLLTDREKRQTTDYEVEIFFVLDFSMYNSWYATTEGESDRHTATINKMIQFTAFLLNAIDLRYQTVTDYSYTISCLFAGVYIANVSSDAPFVEDYVSYDQAIAETVLNAFKAWGENSLSNFNYDHAMLFTGYDIGENTDNVFISDIAGLAYLPSYNENGDLYKAAVCGELRYSINEGGDFSPTMATVGAHELGHNLGSSHDGSSNDCSGGYVMEASYGVTNDTSENLRLWQFSSCSQTYFDTYVTDLNDNSLNCMTVRTATGNDDIDPYINDLAGQLYSPDVQCERMRGTGSFLYRSQLNDDYSTICALMPCASIITSGSYYRHIAWEGTTCGNGKICQSGSCVESSFAPEVNNETCPFGDVPNDVPFQSSGCTDLLGTHATSYYCYTDTYRESCCETCEAIRQSNIAYEDCEYGDRANGCSEIPLISCTVNSELCCRRCQDLKLDIPGCPWGDTYSNCAELPCSTYSVECCQTCAPNTTSTVTVIPTTSATSLSTTSIISTTTSVTTSETTLVATATVSTTSTISSSTTTAISLVTTTNIPSTASASTFAASAITTASSTTTSTVYLSTTTVISPSTTTNTPSTATTSVLTTTTTSTTTQKAQSNRMRCSLALLFCLFLYQFCKVIPLTCYIKCAL